MGGTLSVPVSGCGGQSLGGDEGGRFRESQGENPLLSLQEAVRFGVMHRVSEWLLPQVCPWVGGWIGDWLDGWIS